MQSCRRHQPRIQRSTSSATSSYWYGTSYHLILSSLDATQQRLEIEGSLRDLEAWLGHGVASFAYPYGRTWDYNEETRSILQELGFQSATTAMPGLNDVDTPRLELKRTAVNQSSDLAQIMCEVDGVYRWLGAEP